ncbi:MAG: helix-hairpin-helix domain-containing protein [Bacteroidales bacterium]|nr:helix-hairpin-helix domain-containing protein [Bacteroidales bacterium]
MEPTERPRRDNPASVFKVGAISLAFLIIGYQAALFIHRTSVLRIEAMRDCPDTVFVVDEALARRVLAAPAASDTARPEMAVTPPVPVSPGQVCVRRTASHSPVVQAVRAASRKVESFRFNPNTVGEDGLLRLGFSAKQAAAILHYRSAGGRFRRKGDFARSYAVPDSVFRRLEPFIDIPKVDLNRADSAALDELPGIGGYYAKKILEYRSRLGGFSCPEQLMDLYRFGAERYAALSDLVCCSPPPPFRIWTLPVDSLRRHPYIRDYRTARAIVLYREHTPAEQHTVGGLAAAGILDAETAGKLARCRLE